MGIDMSPCSVNDIQAFEHLPFDSVLNAGVRMCNHQFSEDTLIRHVHEPGLYISMFGVCQGKTLNSGMDQNRDYSHQYMVTVVDQSCSGEMLFQQHSVWQTLSIMLPLESMQEGWQLPEFQANFSHQVPQIRLAELGPIPRDILHCCEAVWSCPLQGAERRLFIQAKAQEALALFIHHRRQAKTQRTPRSRQLDNALNYIQHHLAEDWSLEALAKLAGSNRTYIKQDIKALLGISFQQWLRGKRLEVACEQLAFKRLSIAEIAINVGFKSQAHFATLFKTEYNVTPSEFRQSLLTSHCQ